MFRSIRGNRRPANIQNQQNSFSTQPMQNNIKAERRDEYMYSQQSRNLGNVYDEYDQKQTERSNFDRPLSQSSQRISRNSGTNGRRYDNTPNNSPQRINRFGPRVKNQRSSMSCQDTHVEPLGVKVKDKYLDDTLQQRCISRDGSVLDLIQVSPEKVEEDVTKDFEDFQSKFDIKRENVKKKQKEANNDTNQIDHLTQLLSQISINLAQSQLSNACSQNTSVSNANSAEVSDNLKQKQSANLKSTKESTKPSGKVKKSEITKEVQKSKSEDSEEEKIVTTKKSTKSIQKSQPSKVIPKAIDRKAEIIKKRQREKEIEEIAEKINCAQDTMIDLIAKSKTSTLLNNHYKSVQNSLDVECNLKFLLNRIRCVKRQINCKIKVIKTFKESKHKAKKSNKSEVMNPIENTFIPEDSMSNSEILKKITILSKQYEKLVNKFRTEKQKLDRETRRNQSAEIKETREEETANDKPMKKQRNFE